MLSHYLSAFSNLRTDSSKTRWNHRTTFRAPHKPLLLLAVLDRFAEIAPVTNLVEFDDDLSELFAHYWALVNPPSIRGNIAMPLYHLQSDLFWHLVPREGYEERLRHSGKIHSIIRLREMTYGAKLDDELYSLMQLSDARNALRTVLVDTYFAPELRESLIRQGKINLESYFYSQELLASVKLKESPSSEDDFAVRDQGFKRIMRLIYDHHCALCGIRVQTAEGHTAVVGAHIIPWAVSHNDDPRNGLSLCRLCHWAFDEGLLTVNLDYVVRTSPQLNSQGNVAAHLATLNRRGMIRPADSDFLPAADSLNWHMREVYRKR